ncbi:hypothetical protein PanWU01x14_112420 [Parasponia andersonii]|uniref:KIB1-4 beta-propeller domain-containing protein n=1 Tax=Parasponia andersonii TaxID=3476 RepID=A0A2P5CYE9_PARAD|nr:hypothetical protein PanWU01x14_112420 [Parasponia andersonii]
MLIVPSEKENTWNIYDAVDNSFLESKLVIPYDRRFCGSSNGWLGTVNEDFTITIYKPFPLAKEKSTIHLPCLFPPKAEDSEDEEEEEEDVSEEEEEEEEDEDEEDVMSNIGETYDGHVYKALITTDPLANPNDCMVIVIFGEFRDLAYIRPAKDTKWTRINVKWPLYDILLYKDHALYAIDNQRQLECIDISDPCNIKVNLVTTSRDLSGCVKCYLVRSSKGELLQVERHLDSGEDGVTKHQTTDVRVFKLDFDGSQPRWIEIKSLDDATLFLGDNSSVSVQASNFVGCYS